MADKYEIARLKKILAYTFYGEVDFERCDIAARSRIEMAVEKIVRHKIERKDKTCDS